MSLLKGLMCSIKTTFKTLTSLYTYEKNSNAYNSVKKIIIYYENNQFLHTANIISEEIVKV